MACGGCGRQRQKLKEAVEEKNIRKVVVTAVDGIAMMAGLKEKPKAEPTDVFESNTPEAGPAPEENPKPVVKKESVAVRLKRFQS